MCGFCGILEGAEGRSREAIGPMTDALAHRGPDDRGLFGADFIKQGRSYHLALGHRRLKILDLSQAGRQPMSTADGVLTAVYNGEIYNYRELRSELEALGHAFRSQTDTEVLLEAYREWGLGALERFVGMFAFALFDASTGQLILARDRLGIKPLYYRFREGVLVFGSELSSLRCHPAFSGEIDRRSLGLFLQYGYVPGPGTIYRDTWRLPPGCFGVWDGSDLEIKPFWELGDAETDPVDDFSSAVAQLEEHLGRAVEQRLVSDVPLGAFLSGGVDSSTVVALMKERSRGPVQTFTIGISEPGWNDEAPYARAVAEHLGTDHHELYVDRSLAAEVARDLPLLYDEPFADSSAIPTVLLSRFTRDHVTVALSGDGGDELFGGYAHHARLASLSRWLGVPRGLRRLIARDFRNPLLRRFGDLGPLGAKDARSLAHALVRRSDPKALVSMCGPIDSLPSETWERAYDLHPDAPAVKRAMLADAAVYLPDDILTKVDRASMSVGLEARVPVLDHRVVRHALGFPLDFCWRGGKTKAPLRQILYKRVPPALIERPKQGFGVPVALLLEAELPRWQRHYLARERIGEEGLLDPEAVAHWLQRARADTPVDIRSLFFLISFERWYARHHRGEEAA